MTGPDPRQSELNDAGEAWLSFLAVFVLAEIAMTAVLWGYVSFYWALAGGVPIAIVVGWAISIVRPLRRAISAVVQGLLDLI